MRCGRVRPMHHSRPQVINLALAPARVQFTGADVSPKMVEACTRNANYVAAHQARL